MTLTQVMLIALAITFVFFILALVKYYETKKKYERVELELNLLKSGNHFKVIEYSQGLLDFTHRFILQMAAREIITFRDTHDLSKISKNSVEALAKDVSQKVFNSINEDNILFDVALFDKDAYYQYIVDVTISTIKDLFSKVIDTIEEE